MNTKENFKRKKPQVNVGTIGSPHHGQETLRAAYIEISAQSVATAYHRENLTAEPCYPQFFKSVPSNTSEIENAAASTLSQKLKVLSPGPNAKILEDIGDLKLEIPCKFICPLSLSIMSDPVYLPRGTKGKRFERTWLIHCTTELQVEEGAHPTPQMPFVVTTLLEDIELKKSIDEFVQNIKNNAPSLQK